MTAVMLVLSPGCRPPDASEGDKEAHENDPWMSVLDAALARGIVASDAQDGSYTVDAFVAVLVYEHLTSTKGQPIFSPIEASSDPAGPAGGYRVGALVEHSLYHRLGLREGDVVESINGVVSSSPERLRSALDGAEHLVRITVYREDYSQTLSYHVAPGHSWKALLTSSSTPTLADAGSTPQPAVDVAQSGVPSPKSGHDAPPSAGSTASSASTRSTASRPASTASSSGTKAGSAANSGSAPSASPVRCQSSSQCTVSKAHFDSLLTSPQKLQSQAEIVPAIRNDVHSGYRLKTVRPGTSVAALGFRSGDKITHVNGHDLTNDAQAMQLYMSLSRTRTYNVRYERGTQKLAKTIVVQ